MRIEKPKMKSRIRRCVSMTLWHRIAAARTPRSAAAKAARGQPAATPHAVAAERFVRVLRATWVEAARRWEHGSHEPLVAAHHAAQTGGDHVGCSPESNSRSRAIIVADGRTL